jgi:hypothetical protein
MRSIAVWTALCLLSSCVVVGCSKTESKESPPAVSQNNAAAKPTSDDNAAKPAAPERVIPSAVATNCKLPEPAPTKLAAPDPAYTALFDAAGSCNPKFLGRCNEIQAVVTKAKASVTDSKEAPAAVVAACVAGLDHESGGARRAAAECLMELGSTIKTPAPVALRLLEKLDSAKDSSERFHLGEAIKKFDTVAAGYTCRVLKLVTKLPKDELATAQILDSLTDHGDGGTTNEEGFEFANEFILSNQPGRTASRAMSLLADRTPESRKYEVCNRLADIVKAGVDGWGEASTRIWRNSMCTKRDLVLTNALAKLKWLETQTVLKDTEDQLLNANYIDGLATWADLTDAQKKSICDAAKSLEANGKFDETKAIGQKIATGCAQ